MTTTVAKYYPAHVRRALDAAAPVANYIYPSEGLKGAETGTPRPLLLVANYIYPSEGLKVA